MEKVTGFSMGTYEVRTVGGPPPTIDPEAFQRLMRLIDEHIARAFCLPPHLLATTYEPQSLTLEQLQQLRDRWMPPPMFRGKVVPQPVRDYCRLCHYSNMGVRFCGLGLTMEVGCMQRERQHEQEGARE